MYWKQTHTHTEIQSKDGWNWLYTVCIKDFNGFIIYPRQIIIYFRKTDPLYVCVCVSYTLWKSNHFGESPYISLLVQPGYVSASSLKGLTHTHNRPKPHLRTEREIERTTNRHMVAQSGVYIASALLCASETILFYIYWKPHTHTHQRVAYTRCIIKLIRTLPSTSII